MNWQEFLNRLRAFIWLHALGYDPNQRYAAPTPAQPNPGGLAMGMIPVGPFGMAGQQSNVSSTALEQIRRLALIRQLQEAYATGGMLEQPLGLGQVRVAEPYPVAATNQTLLPSFASDMNPYTAIARTPAQRGALAERLAVPGGLNEIKAFYQAISPRLSFPETP